MTDDGKPVLSATEKFRMRKAAGTEKAKVAVVGSTLPAIPKEVIKEVLKQESPKPAVVVTDVKIKKILVAPSKILTTKCKEVDEIDSFIVDLAHDMEYFLAHPPAGGLVPIGLAAPQMGQSVRVFSCMLNPLATEGVDKMITTIINPHAVYIRKLHVVSETCLSLPGRSFTLKRGKIVKIKGTLLSGIPRSFKGHDIVAQMFQHELDHLDGILLDEAVKR